MYDLDFLYSRKRDTGKRDEQYSLILLRNMKLMRRMTQEASTYG